MRVARTAGLIAFGIVLGVLAGGAMASLHAQYLGLSEQRIFEVGDAKGSFAQPRVIGNGRLYSFVKDSKSGGCWLKYEHEIANNLPPAVALAVAPPEACR
jgi:hypothetical protein